MKINNPCRHQSGMTTKYHVSLLQGCLFYCLVISTARRNLMSRERHYYVCLLTNWNHKVMYIGVTNNLERRIYEHKQKIVKGFTQKYNITQLVYFEETSDIYTAIAREKEIKRWRRQKKQAGY